LDTPLVSFLWNNSEDFLNVNNYGFEINANNQDVSFPFSSLVSIKLALKKKLAPLIAGAIITSLALVNILLEGAALSMIALLSSGLLILYFGLTEYWVISIEQFKESKSIWIAKNKCTLFPKTLIHILAYKISKGFFPPFYASVERGNFVNVVAGEQPIKELAEPIYFFLIPPKKNPNCLLLKVDLSNITSTLTYVVDKDYLAIGRYQLNKEALLNIEI